MNIDFLMTSALEQIASEGPRAGAGGRGGPARLLFGK